MANIDLKEAPPGSKAESILAAAKRTFLAAGFGAVSMDTIAREAGVSKATVYAHFAGKEELFGAVIGRECELEQHTGKAALRTGQRKECARGDIEACECSAEHAERLTHEPV